MSKKPTQLEWADFKVEEFYKQKKILLAAVNKTIKENLHLADGDNCTLIHLKKAREKIKLREKNRMAIVKKFHGE